MKREAGGQREDGQMLNCAQCGTATKVLETRSEKDGIARRRECLRCKARVTTIETVKGSTMVYRLKAAPAPKVSKPVPARNPVAIKKQSAARKRLEELNDMKDVMEQDDFSLSVDDLKRELGW